MTRDYKQLRRLVTLCNSVAQDKLDPEEAIQQAAHLLVASDLPANASNPQATLRLLVYQTLPPFYRRVFDAALVAIRDTDGVTSDEMTRIFPDHTLAHLSLVLGHLERYGLLRVGHFHQRFKVFVLPDYSLWKEGDND